MQDADVGPLSDDTTLAREIQQALGAGDSEVELFKMVAKRLDIKGELANSVTVRTMLGMMWTNVAEFFEEVIAVPSIAQLPHDDSLVGLHSKMVANWECVATINQALKAGEEAEDELKAMDQMGVDVEDEL